MLVLLVDPRPSGCACTRRELPFLAVFGIGGLAFVQWFYFLSIHRLAIGIALLIEYLAPLLVALWARYVFHEQVRRRIWLALALALAGLALIVDVRQRRSDLDGRASSSRSCAAVDLRRSTSCSPSAASATATPSRCSPGASAFAALFWASSRRGGASPRHASARTCRCSAISTATTCRSGR